MTAASEYLIETPWDERVFGISTLERSALDKGITFAAGGSLLCRGLKR